MTDEPPMKSFNIYFCKKKRIKKQESGKTLLEIPNQLIEKQWSRKTNTIIKYLRKIISYELFKLQRLIKAK